MSSYERKTILIPAHAFEHRVLVGPVGLRQPDAQEDVTALLDITAICVTRRPEPRCECGFFDLQWELQIG